MFSVQLGARLASLSPAGGEKDCLSPSPCGIARDILFMYQYAAIIIAWRRQSESDAAIRVVRYADPLLSRLSLSLLIHILICSRRHCMIHCLKTYFIDLNVSGHG
jgi:hypothetical protein